MSHLKEVTEFASSLTWEDIPTGVQRQAKLCLLDTLGAGLAGKTMPLSRIIDNFVATHYGTGQAAIWGHRRTTSVPGAALSNAAAVDALDIHDGHSLTRGHAGAAIVPAALATLPLQAEPVRLPELLTTITVGYEIAIRAGIALHASVPDYHASGAWNSLGCAAITARRLDLKRTAFLDSLGVAEYHGPRAQSNRVLTHPSMVKDGSAWGAMTGVSAALLAREGFTGAPASTVASPKLADHWSDLGSHWHLLDQYFKPDATCRLAQPATEAARFIKHQYSPQLDQINHIEVQTFAAALHLFQGPPTNTEQAQYNLTYPVAAAFVFDRLELAELIPPHIGNPDVRRLISKITIKADDEFTAVFPEKRLARIIVTLENGRRLKSIATESRWEAIAPPSENSLIEKFHRLSRQIIDESSRRRLVSTIFDPSEAVDAQQIIELLQVSTESK